MAASGNRSEEAESMFRLITAAPRPRELTGAVDLINQFGLRAHHEYFCKKPLPASIAETPYLNNVVGDTEIRKGEGMELEQLIQEPPVMDIGFRIQPFDLETLRQALELRENGPIQLSEADRGLPTITALRVAVSSASTPFNSAIQLSSSCFTRAPQISKTVKREKNYKGRRIYCTTGRDKSGNSNTSSSNIVLKVAWYASEALGIAASLFKETSNPSEQHSQSQLLQDEVAGSIPRDVVVDAIRNDYQTSYFVTGNLTISIYKEDCEFADPAGSFKGLKRFKRNCSNFGSLIKTSNMKLMDWKDFEEKGVGYWRFACILAFPWRPILSATGYTEYYYDIESGKICRHVEHWNVPKMVLLKQIFKPNPGLWRK